MEGPGEGRGGRPAKMEDHGAGTASASFRQGLPPAPELGLLCLQHPSLVL